MTIREIIHCDPEILGGTPVFVGTHVPVRIENMPRKLRRDLPEFHIRFETRSKMCVQDRSSS